MKVALEGEFLAYPYSTMINYLETLSDLVSKAKALNEESVNSLIQRQRCLLRHQQDDATGC